MPIVAHRYVLAVPDCEATAAFFQDVLGFRTHLVIPGWHFVEREGIVLMLGSCPDDIPPAELGCHSYFGYLQLDSAASVDALFEEFKANGLQAKPPQDKPWNMREFAVRTPDGHAFTVGADL